jgi:chromosome segregation protein
MVTIKKLEMVGFKTFARKTTLTFDKGLNVILGPNGSGKTNILDSIQFVLGELSARTLRATNFSSLLYHGGSEIPKAKHGSVTIQFDNHDRRIPVDTDIVSVSRYINPDGTSVYRVNGRRYSRSSLVDVLGVAALTGGNNVISQGTTMRIADFSPEDRRKNIEGILGIAEYDKKKHDAQEELREAETNLKVAAGRFEEVRKRVLELEKERNDLLRYNYIKKELNRLRAVKLSAKVNSLQSDIERFKKDIEEKNSKLENFKNKREELEKQRHDRENEWQDYTVKVVDKGGEMLVSLQKEIGDLNSDVAGLKTTISSSKTSIHSYEKMVDDKVGTLKSIRRQYSEANRELRKIVKARDEIKEFLDLKKTKRDEIIGKISEIKQSLDDNTKKFSTIEAEIEQLEREDNRLEVKSKAERESYDILNEQVESLASRKVAFENLHNNFSARYKQLSSMKKKELASYEVTLQTIERAKKQRELADLEIKNAEKIAKQARLNVAEFESRKELADNVLSEENALDHIENLVRDKVLKGIHGRLRDNIRITRDYKKAVEAAAEGWLQALVADNMDTVRQCAESLKKEKIGRVKLLPLESLKSAKVVDKPKIAGVLGVAVDYVNCAQHYRPAVNFVLGDTLIVVGEDAALTASRKGYRAVTVEGDIYEPGLRLEVGFYREPIDLSEVLPSNKAINLVEETVTSFESLLKRRQVDFKRHGDELIRLEGEKVLKGDTIKYFEREIGEITRNINRIHKDIVALNRRLRSFRYRQGNIKASVDAAEARRAEITQQLHNLRVEAVKIRRFLKPETVTRYRSEVAKLDAEINDLQRQFNELNSNYSMYESNIKNIHKPALSTAQKDLAGIKAVMRNRQKDVEKATQKLNAALEKLKELDAEKANLSEKIIARKEEYKKYDAEIGEIKRYISKIDRDVEPINQTVDSIKESLLRAQIEFDGVHRELKELGYEEIVDIKSDDVEISVSLLDNLQEEFENLGRRLNMNAEVLYEPQKENYKQLSVKINQLEDEKREILNFMDSIDKEKLEAFSTAFKKLNEKFAQSFQAITTGRGWLQIQNPEDPFTGGIDIVVEFPGKSEMLITAASGGEKSVVAVCYIFALQSLAQSAPFYIFDEIDAHLDPMNVQRLADLLKQETESSQIISISFKEAIAAKADRIFGVYATKGVSHTVSMPAQAVKIPA